jgi:asparagine N-glycosylation enzyme membrane subunit Stt3
MQSEQSSCELHESPLVSISSSCDLLVLLKGQMATASSNDELVVVIVVVVVSPTKSVNACKVPVVLVGGVNSALDEASSGIATGADTDSFG